MSVLLGGIAAVSVAMAVLFAVVAIHLADRLGVMERRHARLLDRHLAGRKGLGADAAPPPWVNGD